MEHTKPGFTAGPTYRPFVVANNVARRWLYLLGSLLLVGAVVKLVTG